MRDAMRTVSAVVTAVAALSCKDSVSNCANDGRPAIELTITNAQGTDLSRTTLLFVKRFEPLPVDSAVGLHDPSVGTPLFISHDKPGRYYLRMQHDGYEIEERTVVVPNSGYCGEPVTQQVNVVLTPLTGANNQS